MLNKKWCCKKRANNFEDFAAKRRGRYLKNYIHLPIKLHREIVTET